MWGSLRIIFKAKQQTPWSLDVYLRPHHLAEDFVSLLNSVRSAFAHLASRHQCLLFQAVPGIIVDGKWCIQMMVCNHRGSGYVWNPSLGIGYLKGCTARPKRGSKYCHVHQIPPLDSDATEIPVIDAHREVFRDSSVLIEYRVGPTRWLSPQEVPLLSIKNYELEQLPKVASHMADEEKTTSCSKDPTRGVSETYVARKSSGILLATTPCLQIVGVKPMYSSESLTQVLLFVACVLSYMIGVTWVVYDFACGMRRFLKAQRGKRVNTKEEKAWDTFLALHWVLDRLHYQSHKACRDASSKYFDNDVNPHATT